MRVIASGSIALRSLVRMPSMVLRPTTSRITLSAMALTVSRGFSTLKAKSSGAAESMRQFTRKCTATMFLSPVSIRLSDGRSLRPSLR